MTVDERLAILKAEILRWNEQINLVSRAQARRVVDDQVAQCRRGWTLLAADLATTPGSAEAEFFDIGAGAGLPGLVWAAERIARNDRRVRLVEPREKRAWFLKRTARLMGLDTVAVEARRWGEGLSGVAGIAGRTACLSMKALRIDDAEVLGGLAGIPGGDGLEWVTIVRFLPPSTFQGEEPGAWLAGDVGATGRSWARGAVRVVGDEEPSLLLVDYVAGR